jgi:type I restriction enzyme M protein
VPVEEITANGHNLNISRYVQTGADAKAVNVAAEVGKLQDLIARRNDAETVMFGHLQRLGYVK